MDPTQTTPDALRAAMRALIRAFGLLDHDHETPCGVQLPLAHAHALMALAEHGAPLSVGQLTEHLQLDRSNVSRLCARMEEAGHIHRASDPADARARAISLTERGAQLAQHLQTRSRARFEAIHQALSPDQRSQAIGALDALTHAITTTRIPHEETP